MIWQIWNLRPHFENLITPVAMLGTSHAWNYSLLQTSLKVHIFIPILHLRNLSLEEINFPEVRKLLAELLFK